jgi:pimeloyl-ACP methyl ester carboxylesterase
MKITFLSLFADAEQELLYAKACADAMKLWPIPFEERTLTGSYGETLLILSGSPNGSPVILFHPAGCGSVIWYRNVEALGKTHRVIAVDTLGEVNRSRVARPLKHREDLLDWLVQLFDGLQIDRADIIGNSFGGYLGALIAVAMPERVRRLVLISPAATFVRMWPWLWHFVPAYMTRSRILKKWEYDWIWQGYPIDDCIAKMRTISSMSGIPRHRGPEVLSDEDFKRIQAPVLLLIGDHEVIYKPSKAIERAKQLVTNLKAEIVPGGNHNAEYTAAQYVNEKMVSFLSE